ncbi:MAG: DMT family transporter [Candidatus Marinimicrobia bacterium]|nr:DMT family transporter [Candidatus Neomarinimicrobiota bacterium]
MSRNNKQSFRSFLKKNKNYFLYIILCIIWSTTWSAIKIGLEDTPPPVGLALRFTTASCVLFVYIFLTGRRVIIDRRHLLFYFLVGFFNAGLSYYLTYIGMQYIPSSLSSILWTGLPLVVGILSHFLIKGEELTTVKIGAILISTLGVINILSDDKLIFNNLVMMGSLITLAAVLAGAISGVIAKRGPRDYDPVVLTAFSLGFGGIFHLITSTFLGAWADFAISPISVGSILYLGIFGSALVFSIYYYLLQRISLVKMAFITFITPITASLIGWGLLDEPFTKREFLGVAIIFTGLFIYDWKKYTAFIKRRIKD